MLSSSFNQISEIESGAFDKLENLTEIWLRNNKLTKIQKALFQSCGALQKLDLGENQIREIESGAFDKLENLTDTSLNNNKITIIQKALFQSCGALQSLDLGENQISEIENGSFDKLEKLTDIWLRNNKLTKIQKALFQSCGSLNMLILSDNQISEIENGAFDRLENMTDIWLRNNKLTKVQKSSFESCGALQKFFLFENQIREIESGAFDNFENLTDIYLNNNKLTIIQKALFQSCRVLKMLSLSDNQICEIENDAFDKLENLTDIWLRNNKLTKIQKSSFESCGALKMLSLSDNLISEIESGAFDKLQNLTEIWLRNNKLTKIQKALFQSCGVLQKLDLGENQISEIESGAFDKLENLTEILLNNNKITIIQKALFQSFGALQKLDLGKNQIREIESGAFDKLENLTEILLNNNKLTKIHECLFQSCGRVLSLDLENNSISSITFATLEPLKLCSDINIQNNVFFHSKNLYSFFFEKYSCNEVQNSFVNYNDRFNVNLFSDQSCFYIMRRSRSTDKKLIEKNFLSFFLSTSSKVWSAIFSDDKNKRSLKSRFDDFNKENSKLSLLDLIVSVFGEIDDIKIIHLKDYIVQLTRRDPKLINLDFVIRSEDSIEYLCKRNVYAHFESFFSHNYTELLSFVSQADFNSKDFRRNEEDYFKGMLKYIDSSILLCIDFEKCFNIALSNRNSDIAKFVILLLRYCFLKWPESTVMKDALNKFNRNLLLSFESIFENKLDEIIVFLLDIRKLDQLKKNNKEIKMDNGRFLKYDIGQFNAKLPAKSEYIIDESHRIRENDGQKMLEFLELIQNNNDLLRHESNQLILDEKWREKAVFIYYIGFFWTLVFVISYSRAARSNGCEQKHPTNFKIYLAFLCHHQSYLRIYAVEL